MRIETDFLGQRRIPDDVYYGVQTLRGKENFVITGVGISAEPRLVIALAYVKKACAMANRDLGLLDPAIAGAIVNACDRLVAGEFLDQFVIDFIQGGAGTSTNMNANEVIANRALELLGHPRGAYDVLHPNEHVNLSQSTNDVYPTAVKIAIIKATYALLEAMAQLQDSFARKAAEFHDVLKMGRTQLQDAVPMTLGQEFATYAVMLGEDRDRLAEAVTMLVAYRLANGDLTSPVYFGTVMGAWLLKVIVFVIVVLLVGSQKWVDGRVMFFTIIVAVLLVAGLRPHRPD